jgi:hypothetical protein
MNNIFPVDLLKEIVSKKVANFHGEIMTNEDPENKNNKEHLKLDEIGNEADSNKFDEKLTKFLLSNKQKQTRSEKIEKAEQLGLVQN